MGIENLRGSAKSGLVRSRGQSALSNMITGTTSLSTIIRPVVEAAKAEDESLQHTPQSLGWTLGTDNQELFLYKLVVPAKGTPHLDLLPGCQSTFRTPQKVHLDHPSSPTKGQNSCSWPGFCHRQELPFSTAAGLTRHYKYVHAPPEERNTFPCSYQRCSNDRYREPFTRKDHYRTHLRDYHQEDIGVCKGAKRATTGRAQKVWLDNQKKWLAQRYIKPNWWRCNKCLQEMNVKTDGFECKSCGMSCEPQRVEARVKMLAELEARGVTNTDGQMRYSDSPPRHIAEDELMNPFPGVYTDEEGNWV